MHSVNVAINDGDTDLEEDEKKEKLFENDEKEYIVSTMENNVWENGQQINISFDEQKVHLFDKNSGESILGGH